MIVPQHLLDLAGELAEGQGVGAPRQAVLRRAISTAYYAVFHGLLGSVALTFAPNNLWKSQVLFYRALDHGKARERCRKLGLTPLKGIERDFFGIDSFCEEIRTFANNFVELQELRHQADYDPDTRFSKVDAKQAVETAARTLECLEVASPDERNQFLAYLLFGIRSL